MIWFTIALAVIIGSIVWAVFTALRPTNQNLTNFIFMTAVIRNASLVDSDFFANLSSNEHLKNLNLGFEVLAKGHDKALVWYGPRDFRRHFPEISLLEIVDYFDDFNPAIDLILVGHLADPATPLQTSQPVHLIDQLTLDPNEKFFWQVAIESKGDRPNQSNVNLRVIINTRNPQRSQTIKDQLNQITGQNLNVSFVAAEDIQQELEDYRKRRLNKEHSLTIPTIELPNIIKV